MLSYMENIKIRSSFHKRSQPSGRQEGRHTHGFIFREKGSAEYTFADKKLTVHEGEMIFLPRGSAYEYTTKEDGENLYMSINFDADTENAEVAVYSLEDFHGKNYILQSFTELWVFGTESDKYKCFSVFFELLSYISKHEHLTELKKRKYELIEPATEYLKKHIYDSTLKIERLHSLCGISDVYFRRLFEARYGMTPREYVIYERISHAKAIIESGDYDSIKDVSESVGYNDPLYFSKAFKKIYGFSPTSTSK